MEDHGGTWLEEERDRISASALEPEELDLQAESELSTTRESDGEDLVLQERGKSGASDFDFLEATNFLQESRNAALSS